MAPTLDTIAITPLLTAFTAALTGSLHCVGMCGPMRLLAGNSGGKRFGYQLGRGLAYSLLGGLAGTLGQAMPAWALVLLVATSLGFTFFGGRIGAPGKKWRTSIVALAATSPFLLGLSSGLLPCGLLHAWVATAAATASPVLGALLLALLWLGTLPALEISGWALAEPLAWARKKFPRLVSVSFILLAIVPFLLRLHPAHTGELSPSAPLQCHHGP